MSVSLRGVVLVIFHCNDCRWGFAVFHPVDERGKDVMPGVASWRRFILTEHSRTRSSSAVLHARNHIETQRLLRCLTANGFDDTVVIVDGIQRRNAGVVPSVIQDQLAMREKRFQVRIHSIKSIAGLLK